MIIDQIESVEETQNKQQQQFNQKINQFGDQVQTEQQMIQIVNLIGSGRTSKVYRCYMNKINGSKNGSDEQQGYAIKIYEENIPKKIIQREYDNLKKVQGNNAFVQLVSLSDNYLLIELLDEFNLLDYLRISNRKMTLSLKYYLISSLLSAVSHMHHQLQLYHRDLKLENLLFDKDDFTLKISDLGFSSHLNEETSKEHLGTLGYMSPQILRKEKFDLEKTDVFALGVMIFSIIFGYPPFESALDKNTLQYTPLYYHLALQDNQNYWQRVQSWEANTPIDPLLISLINGMLAENETKRLTLHQVLQHPFITQITLPQSSQVIHEMNYYRNQIIKSKITAYLD